jgi:hypothetical protein
MTRKEDRHDGLDHRREPPRAAAQAAFDYPFEASRSAQIELPKVEQVVRAPTECGITSGLLFLLHRPVRWRDHRAAGEGIRKDLGVRRIISAANLSPVVGRA